MCTVLFQRLQLLRSGTQITVQSRSGHAKFFAQPVSLTGVRRVAVLAGGGEPHLGARPLATLTLSMRAFTLSLCDRGAGVSTTFPCSVRPSRIRRPILF